MLSRELEKILGVLVALDSGSADKSLKKFVLGRNDNFSCVLCHSGQAQTRSDHDPWG
jgi:hypothetical protein